MTCQLPRNLSYDEIYLQENDFLCKLIHQDVKDEDVKSIKQELEERLSALHQERESKNKEFETREKILRQMIIEEERLFPDKTQLAFDGAPLSIGISPLMAGLLQKLSSRQEETLSDLIDYARDRDLLPTKGSPGRVVHGALMQLKRRDRVVIVSPKVWAISDNDKIP